MSSASSSLRAVIISNARRRISPRSRGAMAENSGPASTAASSAALASSTDASATSHSDSSVDGSSTASVPLPPSRHSPAMYSCLGTWSTTWCSWEAVIVVMHVNLLLRPPRPRGPKGKGRRPCAVDALVLYVLSAGKGLRRRRVRRRLQRHVEHLVDGHRDVERHLVADLLRHVVQVAPVALRQDHVGQTRRVGGEDLLLEAADGPDATLEGHLTGHPDGVLHRPLGEQRGERGHHRDAGRRAVLGDGAGRDVDVEGLVLELRWVDVEVRSVATDVGEGDLRRL